MILLARCWRSFASILILGEFLKISMREQFLHTVVMRPGHKI